MEKEVSIMDNSLNYDHLGNSNLREIATMVRFENSLKYFFLNDSSTGILRSFPGASLDADNCSFYYQD